MKVEKTIHKNMDKEQPKNVYVSEVKNILITTKELKNGTIYGDELTKQGAEDVQWKQNEEKNKVGTAMVVYSVVDKDNQLLTEQLPFYFSKDYADSSAKVMNRSVTGRNKPYKVKKAYLLYPLNG